LFTLTPHILYIWEKLFFDSIGIAANTKKMVYFFKDKILFSKSHKIRSCNWYIYCKSY